MVDIIGNSFDGLGIIPSSKMIKGGYRTIIGNGSGLFRQVLSFDKGTFANASERYITAKNPTTGLYSITGPFGANVLATRNIGGNTYGQFFRQVTEDLLYTVMIEDYSAAWWGNFDVSVTINQINSPIGTLTADLLTATGSGSLFHNKRSNTVANIANQYNVHGGFFKNNNCGGVKLTAYLYGNPSTKTGVKFSFSTGTFSSPIGSGLDDYGALELANGWWFVWIVYHSTVDQSVYRYNYILDNLLNDQFDQTGESYYWWGGTDELNARYPSFLKLAKATYSSDYFYFPSAIVPTWMKSKFTTKLIPNYDIPYTTEDKPIWSFNKTASTLNTGYGFHGVTCNSTTVYWVDYGGVISSIPIGGGTRSAVASGETTPTDIAVDASGNLYWTNYTGGKIRKKIGAGAPVNLATGLGAPFSVCVDNTHGKIYWCDYSAGKIQSANLDGSSVTDIVTGLTQPKGCATDDIYIYYKSSNNIYKIPVSGGTPILLAATQEAYQISVNDQTVFWSIYPTSAVKCVSKNGGAITTVLSETNVHGIEILDDMLMTLANVASGTLKRRDSVTAWLTTSGTIKVVDGPTTMIETSAATASMHQNVEVEFDRTNGKITLSGFTTGDGAYTDTAWTSPDGYDVEYGCALKGAADFDGLCTVPKG